MDETWLYHYDPETKQQSMQWRHSGSPCPKKVRVQNSTGKVLASIFWESRRHPPKWLCSKGSNYQRGVLLISAGANEEYFEGETPWEDHQEGLVLARQCPGSPGTCNPEETGLLGLPVSSSSTLFSRYGPAGLPPVPSTEKTIERSPFFIAAMESWLDGQPSKFFLSGLQRLEQWAKKCIELRGEYVA